MRKLWNIEMRGRKDGREGNRGEGRSGIAAGKGKGG